MPCRWRPAQLPAAGFRVMMLIGTLDQQHSAAELRDILKSAGFTDLKAMQTGGGYYWLVSAWNH